MKQGALQRLARHLSVATKVTEMRPFGNASLTKHCTETAHRQALIIPLHWVAALFAGSHAVLYTRSHATSATGSSPTAAPRL